MRCLFALAAVTLFATTAHADARRSLSTFEEMVPQLTQMLNENQELVVGGTGPLAAAQAATLKRNAAAFTKKVAIGGSILSSIKFDGVDGESIQASFDKGIKPDVNKLLQLNKKLSASLPGRKLATVKDAKALIGEIRMLHTQYSGIAAECATLKQRLK